MRRLLCVVLIAAVTGLLPAVVRAGNQEAADQIANHLRNSGQLVDYKIGVKYMDGTVWLHGRVRDQDQLDRAMQLILSTPGIK